MYTFFRIRVHVRYWYWVGLSRTCTCVKHSIVLLFACRRWLPKTLQHSCNRELLELFELRPRQNRATRLGEESALWRKLLGAQPPTTTTNRNSGGRRIRQQEQLSHSEIHQVQSTTTSNSSPQANHVTMFAIGSFSSAVLLALLGAAATTTSQVEAHGYISVPKASYANSYTKTSYSATLSQSVNPAFQGRKWNGSPENNTQQFTAGFRAAGYPSLKTLLDPAAPGCGNSRLDVPAVDVSGLSAMEFRNDEYHEGFVSSHHGPCEVWIDNTRAFHGDDCRALFPGFPASIPVNFSLCKGKCTLTFYWLALHEPTWQVYKQCAPILNGDGKRLLRQ